MSPNNADTDADGFTLIAQTQHRDMRLDQFLSEEKACSRNLAASLIKNGVIRINGRISKPSHRLKAGETISGAIPTVATRQVSPESIPLNILFEDPYLVIINKPPDLVVHPAPGHDSGTLVNGLLSRYPDIRGTGVDMERPGIVHRLDKDTSGAIIITRTQAAFDQLTAMFAARKINKKYLALIYGTPEKKSGFINLPIGRHMGDRKKMSTRSSKTRAAETHWRLMKAFNDASLLEVAIKTGRTHQIRVHCASSGMPVVGDRIYNNTGWTKQAAGFKDKTLFKLLKNAPRQMLHAWKVDFIHPVTGRPIKCRAPLSPDMKQLLLDIGHAEKA